MGRQETNNMTISNKIKILILDALEKLEVEDINFVVEHPEDIKNGDYSTNVAMAAAKAWVKILGS